MVIFFVGDVIFCVLIRFSVILSGVLVVMVVEVVDV